MTPGRTLTHFELVTVLINREHAFLDDDLRSPAFFESYPLVWLIEVCLAKRIRRAVEDQDHPNAK